MRGMVAMREGGPKGPVKPFPRVSASRHGGIATKAMGGVGKAASTPSTGSSALSGCTNVSGETKHRNTRAQTTRCRSDIRSPLVRIQKWERGWPRRGDDILSSHGFSTFCSSASWEMRHHPRKAQCGAEQHRADTSHNLLLSVYEHTTWDSQHVLAPSSWLSTVNDSEGIVVTHEQRTKSKTNEFGGTGASATPYCATSATAFVRAAPNSSPGFQVGI